MIQKWFECKVSYDKMLENGLQKKVTESYLVDALSHTEAEARFTEKIRPYMSGEFEVVGIRPLKLGELFFNPEGDRWFKAKINFITLDEKSGQEKKTAVPMLAQASGIHEALAVVDKGMEATMADYTITELKETLIMDVFPYSESESE